MKLLAGQMTYHGLLKAGDDRIVRNPDGSGKTGNELIAVVSQLTGFLDANGLRRKRVGVWSANSIATLEIFLAIEWIGATRVALDPALSDEEAHAQFAAAGVDDIVADAECAKRLDRDVLVHTGAAPLAAQPVFPSEWVRDETAVLYPRHIHNGELVSVSLSHWNWISGITGCMRLYQTGGYGRSVESDELFLTTQQIVHGTCQLGTIPFLCMGLPQVILPKFDIPSIVETVKTHKITSLVLISEMIRRICRDKSVSAADMSSVRHIVYGGGPLSPEELLQAGQVFGDTTLNQIYGRIEAGWPLTVLRPDDLYDGQSLIAGREASCGRAVNDIEMNVGGVLQGPAEGPVKVRNSMVAADYQDAEGWCRTGDIMRRDADGYLYHIGRIDRQINCAGYHVFPEEIEEAIEQMDGIVKARVVGEERPNWGITLVAELELVEGASSPDWTEEIRSYLSPRLAKFKIPRESRVVASPAASS